MPVNLTGATGGGQRLPVTTGRLVLIILAGPFIGALAYMLVLLAIEGGAQPLGDLFAVGALILVIGWPLGTAGAMLSALVLRLFGLAAAPWRRALELLVLGALSGPLGVAIMAPVLGMHLPPLSVFAILALCGAAALLSTTLPFHRRAI